MFSQCWTADAFYYDEKEEENCDYRPDEYKGDMGQGGGAWDQRVVPEALDEYPVLLAQKPNLTQRALI